VKFNKTGKPIKPDLLTLDVNLTGVIYSKSHLTTKYLYRLPRYLFTLAVHLSVHYLKLNQNVDNLKSLILIGSLGKKLTFSPPPTKVNTGASLSSIMVAYTRSTLLHGFKARHFRDYEITSSSP